jgi:hypothetical protein
MTRVENDGVELLTKEIERGLQNEQMNESELFLVIQRIMQLAAQLFANARAQNRVLSHKQQDLMLEQLSKNCALLESWKSYYPQLMSGILNVTSGAYGLWAQGSSIHHVLTNPGLDLANDRFYTILKDKAGMAQMVQQSSQSVHGLLSPITAYHEAEKKSSETLMGIYNGAKSTHEQSAHQDAAALKALMGAIEQAIHAYLQAGRSVAQ